MLRVMLVAPICWLLWHRNWPSSLMLVVVAGVSDGVDGFLARRYGWQSRLGGMLDAIADKLLLISCFVLLMRLGEVPAWLTLIVCLRDLVIAMGALLWRLMIGRIYPQPSVLSKMCTFIQIVYLVCVLLRLARWPAPTISPWLVAGLCVASGADYIVRWSLKAWQSLRGRSEQTKL